jgi:hypothetical protein
MLELRGMEDPMQIKEELFQIGYGTADAYRKRFTIAIRSLKDRYFYWPDEEERLEISREIIKKYDFPHSIEIVLYFVSAGL